MADVQQLDAIDAPARRLAAVTPADADLPYSCKALFVGGAGNLVVIAADDSVAVTLAVGAGAIVPVRARRVAAATTATGIVALI